MLVPVPRGRCTSFILHIGIHLGIFVSGYQREDSHTFSRNSLTDVSVPSCKYSTQKRCVIEYNFPSLHSEIPSPPLQRGPCIVPHHRCNYSFGGQQKEEQCQTVLQAPCATMGADNTTPSPVAVSDPVRGGAGKDDCQLSSRNMASHH